MQHEDNIRREICAVGYKLYSRNYVVATDGNLSVRLPGNILLCTPSGACKGELAPEQLLKIDLQGRKISGPGTPSSELRMHLVIYKERPDIRAVVHAHPLTTVSLTVVGKSLQQILIPEVAIHVGPIAVAPYATPGTEQLAQSIRPFLKEHDAVVMERHGVVTAANSITEAYYKVECIEYAAQVAWLAGQMGTPTPLDIHETRKLQQLRQLRLSPYQSNTCALTKKTK